eukprot:873680-Lingulodinium_polyedra.AAC.1
MGLALGMDEAQTLLHLVQINAKRWTALPRERILLATLPVLPGKQPPVRDPPWDPSWGPHRYGSMAPMMRSRGRWSGLD